MKTHARLAMLIALAPLCLSSCMHPHQPGPAELTPDEKQIAELASEITRDGLIAKDGPLMGLCYLGSGDQYDYYANVVVGTKIYAKFYYRLLRSKNDCLDGFPVTTETSKWRRSEVAKDIRREDLNKYTDDCGGTSTGADLYYMGSHDPFDYYCVEYMLATEYFRVAKNENRQASRMPFTNNRDLWHGERGTRFPRDDSSP